VAFLYRAFGLAVGIALLGAPVWAQDKEDSASNDDAVASAADTAGATHGDSTTGAGMRRQKIELAKSQVESAQQMLDDAKKKGSLTEAEVDAMQKRIDQARDALESVDTKLQTVRKGLKDVEDNLLTSQPKDSDVGKAQAAFLKAKEDLDREADRVIHSPECQKRLKRVENVVDASKLRAFIRRDALENDARYHKALLEYQYTRKEFNRLKAELFSGNAEWGLASDTVREAEEKARKLRQLWAGIGF
jgi:hypothetical protein